MPRFLGPTSIRAVAAVAAGLVLVGCPARVPSSRISVRSLTASKGSTANATNIAGAKAKTGDTSNGGTSDETDDTPAPGSTPTAVPTTATVSGVDVNTDTATNFSPEITVAEYAMGTKVLTLQVDQEAGEADIKQILASVPEGSVTVSPTLSTTTPLTEAGSQVTMGASAPKPLRLDQNASAFTSLVVAGAPLTAPDWKGYLILDPTGSAVRVARFGIFLGRAGRHGMAFDYNLNDAVVLNGGHGSIIKTKAFTAIIEGTSVSVTFVSRTGEQLDRTKTITRVS